MPRVDVFVPCYNYGRYLRDCVESITTQTDVEVRVLIINDASTDDSHEVATALASEDSRISYRRHITNAGHIATYNEALEWASSEYTVLLSADDMLTAGSLSRAARLMDAHPQIGFVYGRNIRLKDGQPLAPACTPYPDFDARVWNGLDWLESMLRDRKTFIASPEVVVRTRMYKSFGGYRPELPHTADVELWLRLAAHGDVGEIETDQAYYRIHDSNMHGALAPSTLRSLEHWIAAVDIFFSNDGTHVPGSAQLQQAAAASLANTALNAAYAPTDRRDQESRADLIAFATRICPSVESARGRLWCGYRHGRAREPWGLRTRFGAPAYLFRRLMADTHRGIRLLLSRDLRGSAFELGRSSAHASLILDAWLATLARRHRVGAGGDFAPVRCTVATGYQGACGNVVVSRRQSST
jgi:GT2 family glycosyltransferase